MDQNHFEASQCPQVVGSAQDGERDQGSRPMRRRILNALNSENRQKSDKKGFENYEFLYDN